MIIAASEMRAETEETIENELMKFLHTAAQNKTYETIVSEELVPDWLGSKLISFGYRVEKDEDLELVTISWGQTDVE